MTTSPVMGITDELLAELEEAAKAATPGPQHIYTHPRDDNNWQTNRRYHETVEPQRVVALIARIRELEAREIVLPIQPVMSMYASADECRAALDAHNRCQAAIEEAGVRVKQ